MGYEAIEHPGVFLMSAKPPKKNETIEIRLPDQAKTAFMDHCRRENRSASEAIRAFIDEQLAQRPGARQPSKSFWRVLVAAIFGTILGVGVAAPSLASSTPNTRPEFDRLDRDHNGMLTYDEFRAR